MLRLVTTLLFISACLSNFSQYFTIGEAIEADKIDCEITGAWNTKQTDVLAIGDGKFFGKCITIELRNNTRDSIEVLLPVGLQLVPEDETTQGLILTKSASVVLEKKEKATFTFYAVSTDATKEAPTYKTEYTIGAMAEGDLLEVAKTIEAQYAQNIVGQSAVWAVTNSYGNEDLMLFGANDYTLWLSRALLDSAKVTTAFNPPVVKEVKVDSVAILDSIHKAKAHASAEKNFTVKKPIGYGILGIAAFLLFLVIFLLIRFKIKNRKPKAPKAAKGTKQAPPAPNTPTENK